MPRLAALPARRKTDAITLGRARKTGRPRRLWGHPLRTIETPPTPPRNSALPTDPLHY